MNDSVSSPCSREPLDGHNDFNDKNNNKRSGLYLLSVTDLKRLLSERGIDFRDCIEKRELLERLENSETAASSASSRTIRSSFRRKLDQTDKHILMQRQMASTCIMNPEGGHQGSLEEKNSYHNLEDNNGRDDGLMRDKGRRNGEVDLLEAYEKYNGFRQEYGYFAILFSVVQTIILIIMMVQCGVAPLQINPMVGPQPEALSYWGAKNGVLIIDDGEYWRLGTCMMLHAGVFHWIGNIHIQCELGVFFEREWGSVSWLIIYLTSAVGSSVLSTIFLPDSLSVGSSGAIMGLMGGKISEIFCRMCAPNRTREERVGHAMRKEQWGMMMCFVIIVMLLSFVPFIDWAAHLGGLIVGMTVGLAIFSFQSHRPCLQILYFCTGVASTVVYFAVSLWYMYDRVEPNEILRDVCDYYRQFFEGYECTCQNDHK